MLPRRTIVGFTCVVRTVIAKIQTRPLANTSRNPSSRGPLLRKVPSETAGSKQAHEKLPPLVLRPSTELIYSSAKGQLGKGEKHEMTPQSMQIPGLTLLHNLAPHAIAPTSEGSFISPVAAQPPAKAPYVLPRKMKENKKAKARRALAEAQAQAQAQGAANRTAQAPAPYGQQHGTYNFDDSNFNNASFMMPPNNFANPNTSTTRPPPPPTGPRSHSKNPPRDERVAPSKASGGIPDPTPLYISRALPPPSSLRQPRRILVVVDLNGTLLYRPNKRNPFNFIQRPHAREFLDYCVDTFHVAIWSSARPENVDKMVSQLLSPQQRARCLVVWGRDRFGLSPADYSARVQCYKRLSSIWNDPRVAAAHPAAARGQRWDQTDTVLVDDSAEKGRSEPYNILQLPEFEGLANEPPNVLPQVHDYLNALCYQANISSYMRQRPFRIDSNYRLPPPPDVHNGVEIL